MDPDSPHIVSLQISYTQAHARILVHLERVWPLSLHQCLGCILVTVSSFHGLLCKRLSQSEVIIFPSLMSFWEEILRIMFDCCPPDVVDKTLKQFFIFQQLLLQTIGDPQPNSLVSNISTSDSPKRNPYTCRPTRNHTSMYIQTHTHSRLQSVIKVIDRVCYNVVKKQVDEKATAENLWFLSCHSWQECETIRLSVSFPSSCLRPTLGEAASSRTHPVAASCLLPLQQSKP